VYRAREGDQSNMCLKKYKNKKIKKEKISVDC
jgi:hypothetical protein